MLSLFLQNSGFGQFWLIHIVISVIPGLLLAMYVFPCCPLHQSAWSGSGGAPLMPSANPVCLVCGASAYQVPLRLTLSCYSLGSF